MSLFIPAEYDIEIREGAQFTDSVRLFSKTASGLEQVSVSGHSAEMHVRTQLAQDDPVLVLSTSNGRLLIDGDTLRLVVPESVIAGLTPWEAPAVYDLRLVSPEGKAFFAIKGRAWFIPRVSR